MPLLARMLASPLSIDVRRGAIADLGLLLADRRIANEGRIAVAVGPGQGARIVADLNLPHCEVFQVDEGTVDVANELGKKLRTEAFEAVAGIGGGKTIDVTKFAATMAGIPMIAVATNLSHDGICSPVSTLDNDNGRGSYGVPTPIALVIDLDVIHQAPDRYVRSGIGDAIPPGAEPQMGPIATGLGEIVMWTIEYERHGAPATDGRFGRQAETFAQETQHDAGIAFRPAEAEFDRTRPVVDAEELEAEDPCTLALLPQAVAEFAGQAFRNGQYRLHAEDRFDQAAQRELLRRRAVRGERLAGPAEGLVETHRRMPAGHAGRRIRTCGGAPRRAAAPRRRPGRRPRRPRRRCPT